MSHRWIDGAGAAAAGESATAGQAPQVEVASEPARATATRRRLPQRRRNPRSRRSPKSPTEPAFVQHVLAAIDGSSSQWRHGYAEIKVPRERLLEAARSLKDDGFDYLSFITEVDWQDRLELIYHLFAYDYRSQPLGAILRCELRAMACPRSPR